MAAPVHVVIFAVGQLAAFTVVPDIVRCVQLAVAPECRQSRLLPFLHPQPLSIDLSAD
jgi:hypothetical protein